MFGFIPKNDNFFEFFDNAARNIVEGTKVLDELFANPSESKEKSDLIKDIEHAGDKITHDTMNTLNKTFVTPIDREDIHSLICALDDVMDYIDDAANKFHLYKFGEATNEVKEMSAILLKCSAETVKAVTGLEKLDTSINEVCIEINSLENEADRISGNAIAQLFENEKDPIQLIKWKELYETLEEAADGFEDVANILEGIVVKHA